MFKLEPNPTFLAPVSGFKPGDGAKESILVEFKYRTAEELSALSEWAQDKTGIEQLLSIMVGWRDMPISLDTAGLEQVIKLYPKFFAAVIETYGRELLPAAQKN